jgi:hypothetical protein
MSQEPGIRDLPSAACRLYFAKAVLSEKRGKPEEAEEFLEKAVRAETFARENK